MSGRGISGVKKKGKITNTKKKTVEFVYSLKTINHRFEFRQSVTSLLIAVRTSIAADTKRRS